MLNDQSPAKSLMQQLIRYVEKQWLNKSTVGPSRPYVRDNQARTNNAVESFHTSLRRMRRRRHRGWGWPHTAANCCQHQWRRRYDIDCVSRRSGLLRDVFRGTAWRTLRAGAVRSSAFLRVVRQRSARPKPWLSSLPHTYHNGAAPVGLLNGLIQKSTQFFCCNTVVFR